MKQLNVSFLIAFVLLCTPFVTQAQAPNTANVPTALTTKAAEKGQVQVIVNLNLGFQAAGDLTPSAARDQEVRIKQAQQEVLTQLSSENYELNQQFQYVPGLALSVNVAGLEQLKQLPIVTSVVEDNLNKLSLAQSTPLIGATNAWRYGYTGAGWTVAVLDSGVDSTHPFLQNKVVSEACYSSRPASAVSSLCPNGQTSQIGTGAGRNCSSSLEGCEHGTHVAGIVAGKGSSFSGVAPDAKLIAIQVFSRINDFLICFPSNSCISAYDSSIIAGLERVFTLRNDFKIASVNMSLGGGSYTNPCDNSNLTVKAAIDNLRSVGIATIIASGNDGYKTSIARPACISSAISVGATTNDDIMASFSNRAYFLSLVAPGYEIYSSIPNGGFENLDGTSMAAPHVAGAWAIRKQIDPTASVSSILDYFRRTSVGVYDSASNRSYARIQVDEELPTPDMTLTETVNKTEAVVGDLLTYTYSVQNTGQVALTLSGTDNHGNTLKFSPNPLSVGQTATAIVQHTVTSGDLPGPYTSQATVTGQGGSSSVQKTASKSAYFAAIAFTRSADRTRAKVGDTINYSYQVVNKGSVTLSLSGQDERSGFLSFSLGNLSAGQTTTSLSSYLVNNQNLPGPLSNQAIVTARSARGTAISLLLPSSIDVTQLLEVNAASPSDQIVTTAQDVVTVDFPATALPGGVTQFAYTRLGSPLRLPAVLAGLAFDSVLQSNTSTFQTTTLPLTFTIHYQESDLPSTVNEAELTVYHYDITSQQWLAMPQVITDTTLNTVVFTSTNLGEYALTGHLYTHIYYLPVIRK